MRGCSLRGSSRGAGRAEPVTNGSRSCHEPVTASRKTSIMMKGRLLLVEDDPALTDLLKWHFEREDFNVEHTPDGEEALLLAAESQPDIVLLDWMIEGISGLEVCRRLRRTAETANVPI